MKIVKTFSKLKEGFISVLCINTGANTYKANLFSNILYLLDRKKEYNDTYKLLGEDRKKFFLIMLIIFFFCISLGILYLFTVNVSIEIDNLKSLVFQTITKLISKGFMPSYFFTKSIIILLSLFNLKNEKILCFEKSKILCSSTINTIFFGKTGTLCENKFNINGYHPLYISPHNSNYKTYKTYNSSQSKDLNSQLVRFYRNYLKKINIHKESNMRHGFKKELNQLKLEKMDKDICEYSAIFLECLLSCNNLEKYNIEIIGNPIEKEIFENIKWDIKTYNFSSNSQDKELLEEDNSYFYEISNNKYSYDHNNSNLIDKRIHDIYPNNYYKITETSKNKFDLRNSKTFLYKKNISNTSDDDDYADFVKKNISKNNIKSYKLRIYKRFTKNGTLDSSAIVYNFITKDLRFMTKGVPEMILDKCNQNSLPENFDRVISYYRKNGLIVIICASKLINIEEYKDSNLIDDYMKDLNFCGFITLKNELKKEIINSIKDLKRFNCNCLISTGDNVYNSLSVGFESGIIDNKNKNIFSFDKEDKQNKITISKIYNANKVYSDELEIKSPNSFIDKCSKNNSRKVNNIISSQNTKMKETVILKSNDSTNYSLITRKATFHKNEFLLNPSNQNMSKINKKDYSKNENYFFKRNNKRNHTTTKKGINFLNKKIYQNNYESNMESSEIDDLNKNLQMNPKYNYNNKVEDIRQSSIDKKSKHTYKINKSSSNIEKYDYYPDIFEDNEEMASNCIYCISGNVFKFLYKNKEKKKYKKTLNLILKNCKIFYDMSSLDKSLAIDFFRESPKNRICYIGECQSDYDAIMTSNIGISLKPPKNLNTIFCHFYSEDSNILSIKKIIREGRAITENIMLLRMSSVFFTIIINSYVMCCLIRHVRIIDGQLILLEISFFILAISAFSAKYDTFSQSNCLIQNEKLYKRHYYIQIIGILLIKLYSVYRTTKFYHGNDYKLEERINDLIYCCFYFIFCVEQLMSTIFVCNIICFYRKSPFTNIFFVILNIILLLYFIILVTLSSSNYRCDIFNITFFEQLEELVDSFDDQNKLNCFWLCIIDLVASIFYSKLVFYIFNKLAQRSSE
jgi:magnesium-transporting ATPase (P-type)